MLVLKRSLSYTELICPHFRPPRRLGPPQPPLQVSSPPQQQQQQRPRPDISNAFEDLAAGGLGEPVSSQHSQSHAPPVAEATAALAATSLAFGATGGGGVSSPAPPAAQSSASLAGTVSGHSSTEFKSNDVVQELAASSEGLLEVTQSLVGQHAQGMAAQRASLDSMRKLIQRLQAEKVRGGGFTGLRMGPSPWRGPRLISSIYIPQFTFVRTAHLGFFGSSACWVCRGV